MVSTKTVLITGCSDGGIGSALAITFAQQGFRVFATARNLAKVSQLENLPNVTLLELDVTNATHIKEAVVAVSKQTGGTLDYLIHNAATNHFMPLLDEDLNYAKLLFEKNTFAPIAIVQAFADLVIKAKGAFVFITSSGGYTNVPYMGTDNASKRALEIMAECFRQEMKPLGVQVLCIVTGVVKTMGQTYFEDLTMLENSLYKPIEPKLQALAKGQNPFPKMPAMDYAKGVVQDIIRGRTGRSWHSAGVGFMKALIGWAPQSWADWIFAKDSGVDTWKYQGH